MEENSKFTYKLKRNQQNAIRSLAIFGAAAVVLLVLAIVLGVVAGKASARKKVQGANVGQTTTESQSETEAALNVVTTVPVPETEAPDPNDPYPASTKYPAGKYVVVDTNGNGLNVRSAPSVEAERVSHLEEGESILIAKVVEVTDDGDTSYWGQFKLDSDAFGYVSMSYLKAAE